MTLPTPSDGDIVAAADINAITNTLTGASGNTAPYHLRQSSGHFLISLADHAGVDFFKLLDSNDNPIFDVDSLGNVTITGALTYSGALVAPLSAAPSETAAGSLVWDTVNKVLTAGDGTNTQTIGLARGAGLLATAAKQLAYDTTTRVLSVWDGTKAERVDGPRSMFLSGRRKVLEASGEALQFSFTDGGAGTDYVPVGVGLTVVGGAQISAAGDGSTSITTSASSGTGAHVSTGSATVKPTKNPSMVVTVTPPANNAALAAWQAGFVDDLTSNPAVANGAYLRRTTTGHVFFVTRQSGAETTTDLGDLTTVQDFVIETQDAGVTWKCYNASTGAVLATSTTNVPTVGTGLYAGVSIKNNTTTNLTTSLWYLYVERDID